MTVKRGPMIKSSGATSSAFSSQKRNTVIAPTASSSELPSSDRAINSTSGSSGGASSFGIDVNVESNAEEEEMRMLREQRNKISVRLVFEKLSCLIAVHS